MYFYEPPTSFSYRVSPNHQDESTYFGPAIAVGLVFTFVFVHFWRKHVNEEENEAMFLEDDEFLDEEEGSENITPTRPQSIGGITEAGEIALASLNRQIACNDDEIENATSRNPLQNMNLTPVNVHEDVTNMIPIVSDESDDKSEHY